MTSGEGKARAAQKVADLSRHGLDVAAFWRECDQVIAPIVPVLLRPCWFTMDPASLTRMACFGTSPMGSR